MNFFFHHQEENFFWLFSYQIKYIINNIAKTIKSRAHFRSSRATDELPQKHYIDEKIINKVEMNLDIFR